jgi:hypothetical protein
MKSFDHESLHQKRHNMKILGWILLGLGILTIIDMSSNVPIPLTGLRAILVGSSLAVAGAVGLYFAYRLPVKEALDWIYEAGPNGVSVSDLISEMRVNRTTAAAILESLIRQGYIQANVSRREASMKDAEERYVSVAQYRK